jgi:hypothetical protein
MHYMTKVCNEMTLLDASLARLALAIVWLFDACDVECRVVTISVALWNGLLATGRHLPHDEGIY